MDFEELGDRMESLLDSKQQVLESIEKSEMDIARINTRLSKIRETMRNLKRGHKVVILSEYEYLKNRETELLSHIQTARSKIQSETEGMADLDREIEDTMIDINLASKRSVVLEFSRDSRRRNEA